MNKRILFSLFGLSVLFLFGNGEYLIAGKKDRVEIKHKSRDLQKVNTELKKKSQEKEKLEKESQELETKVKKNASKVNHVEKSLLFTIKRNREIQQDMALKKMEYEKIKSEIYDEKSQLKDTVQLCFVAGQLRGPASSLPVFSRQLLRSQSSEIKALKGQEREANQSVADLFNTFNVYQTEIQHQEGEIQELRRRISDGKRKIRKNKTRQEVLASELAELKKTAEELEGLIDVLNTKQKKERELEKQERLQKMAMGKSPVPRHSLVWPVNGKVVRPFGRQKHPELGTPFISNGLLIRASKPHPVTVVASGQIIYVGDFMSYGPMVLVEHPGDWVSVYANLNRWAVEKGQEVKKGDVMGWTGVDKNGKSQAYFELRFYGKPTNPIPWLIKNPQ